MAVKIQKTTDQKKVLKIISVTDSAIDWDESYPNAGDLEDDDADEEDEKLEDDSALPTVAEVVSLDPVEQKKAHYRKHHDESKLKFKADDKPTLFVFGHPHRADVSRKMRELAGSMYANDRRGNKEKVDRDMFTAVFHHFYLGMEQGFEGQRELVARVNGRLTDETLQGLEDSDVFIELNSAFMRTYNQDRSKGKEHHSEK